MEELELYVENMIKDPDALKSYKFIIALMKKILISNIIEYGGLNTTIDGIITKEVNNIKITIEKYDPSTIYHMATIEIKGAHPKTITVRANIKELKECKINWHEKYGLSPVEFDVDMPNMENGTISIEKTNMFYYDPKTTEEYVSETKDNIPTNRDFKKTGRGNDYTKRLSIKDMELERVCQHIHSILQYGMNAPVIDITLNGGARNKERTKGV